MPHTVVSSRGDVEQTYLLVNYRADYKSLSIEAYQLEFAADSYFKQTLHSIDELCSQKAHL